MAIDQRYIPAFTIEDVILDKDTGAPLTGGLVYFWRDSQCTDPKPVYQITGTSPDYSYIALPNPMTLSSIGTFVDALDNPVIPYFLPWVGETDEPDYYFIEVFSSEMVSQFTREAVPFIPSSLNPSDNAVSYTNELTNPQFAQVLFDTSSATATYTFSGATIADSTPIAPGWDLVVAGTGSVTVSQITPTGQQNYPSNPGTILGIIATGVTTCRLRQRLQGIPALFAGANLSATLLARVLGSAVTIRMYYLPSDGVTDPGIPIIDPAAPNVDATHSLIYGNVTIPASISTESFPDAYVDIFLDLPISVQLELSSIQLVCTDDLAVEEVPYDEISIEQQTNDLYWYDKPQLEYKPIPSYLVGWDFPKNPAQFVGSTVPASGIGPNKSKYVWDQTIIFQSADGGVGVTRADSGALVLTAAFANKMAIIQYLPAYEARKILNAPICCNVSAIASADVTATVSLWYTENANVPNVNPGSNLSLVSALDNNGKPSTFVSGWIEVPKLTGDTKFTIETSSDTNFHDYAFSGWDMEGIAVCNTATWFAIVVGTGTVPQTKTVSFNSVSLQAGSIATRPAPQTFDEVVRECEYYYEKSKDTSVPITTPEASSALLAQMDIFFQSANIIAMWPRSFGLQYRTLKYDLPTVRLYAEDGTADSVTAYSYQGGVQIASTEIPIASAWAATDEGRKAIQYIATYTNTATGLIPISPFTVNNTSHAFISYHYEADARIGII